MCAVLNIRQRPVATFCIFLATLRIFSTVQCDEYLERANERERRETPGESEKVSRPPEVLIMIYESFHRQAASSSDIGRWWEDLSDGGSPSVADMWVEAAATSVSVAEPKRLPNLCLNQELSLKVRNRYSKSRGAKFRAYPKYDYRDSYCYVCSVLCIPTHCFVMCTVCV
jgi:hypothetical protein